MNNNDYNFEIHSLFPTPLCVTEYQPTDELCEFLIGQRIAGRFSNKNGQITKQNFGTVSENVQMLRTPQCADLRQYILGAAKILANDIMGFKVDAVVDVLSWVSIKDKAEQHQVHSHPNSMISGVYYFDKNTTPISFVDTSNNTKTFEFRVGRNFESQSAFSANPYTLLPKVGSLVMFPSYLNHCVNSNETQDKRYSLAFNIVPKFKVGTIEELTLFNYGDAI